MGRVKLQIKKIENTTNRQVTFSKRRNGLIKKAYELSVLCDVDVALIMFSPSGRLSLFSGNKSIEEILIRYLNLPEHERGRLHNQEFLQRTLGKLKAEAHQTTYQAPSSSPVLSNNDSRIEEFEQEIVKFKSQIEDMEKRLRIFEGDLSNLTTLCEAEHQEQILEEVLKRVRMHKQVLEERYNSPAAPPVSQVQISPATTDLKGFASESPNNILDWLPQRDPHVQILNFLDSNGLLPVRDGEQRVAELLPPAASTLLDGQNLNLIDHISPGEDNNIVQRSEFGQVINGNLSPWTVYQTGNSSSIPATQSRERAALPAQLYLSHEFTPSTSILAPHDQYPT